MLTLEQYRAAEALEQYLGDPADADNVFSFTRSIELDERDAYPEEACELLNRWELDRYYIPADCGGKLNTYEEVLSLFRVVAHRDFTVAWAHGMNSVLGAANVWVGGNQSQKARLAQILTNHEQVAVAYHESAHGSDLLAVEAQARKAEDGYVLSGEKWVIGNATRGAALTVFARTSASGGPRGFSLFFVEKNRIQKSAYTHLPRSKTYGIRGADISGIRFNECLIPGDSLIGSLGSGLELTLKSFQITRTLFSALSLGAADRALRTALGFSLSRTLYGGAVYDIPHAQSTLVDAFLDLLICDCVAISAARALHVATDQTSFWSSVAKYFVPATIEDTIRNLSVVLGARYYLREEYSGGVFQKLLRDSAVVSLGHAGSFVNLTTIGQSLRYLVEYDEKTDPRSYEELRARLAATFSLDRPLPRFDPEKLQVFNRERDDISQGIKVSLAQLQNLRMGTDVDPQVVEALLRFTTRLLGELNVLNQDLIELAGRQGNAFAQSPEHFELSKRYCTLEAAAACLHMWIHNRKALGRFFSKGEWLALCLNKLLSPLAHGHGLLPRTYAENVAEELTKLYREGRLFSIVPLRLACAGNL